MDTPFLSWLCCPFCGGHFNVSKPTNVEAGNGILNCYCGRFPLVAGIPILKKDATVDSVVALIQAGRSRDALLTLISPNSPALAPRWMQALPSVKLFRWIKHFAHKRALSGWRERAATLLTGQSDRVTACDLFKFYFNRKKGNYDYFALRPGQPRHLSALSFVTIIRQPQKPILDLACGCGHLTYSLTQRAEGQQVIGIDDSFFGLYVAKHWIAPQAEYVCSRADLSLPFPDDAFSTVFCSDAFHYFDQKLISFRELERLTRDNGVIILTWVHNALWRCSHDGFPLPPEGYEALIGDIPHRLVADSEVLSRYIAKKGPPLARSASRERLANEPVLSIVATRKQDIFQDHGCFENWPHAEGCLKLNPLFVTDSATLNGDVRFHRRFPSAFYEEEHKQCKTYLPEELIIPSATLDQLASGKRTSEIDRLIEQLVVVGIPERYR